MIKTGGDVQLIFELLNHVPFSFHLSNDQFEVVLYDSSYRYVDNWHFFKGIYHHRNQQLDKAMAFYKRVLTDNPTHAAAFYKAGQIRLYWEEMMKAEINFRNAERFGCDSIGLIRSKAQLLRLAGKGTKARQLFAKYHRLAQKAASKKAPGRLLNTVTLVESGRITESRADTSIIVPGIPPQHSDSPPWLMLGAAFLGIVLLIGGGRQLLFRPPATVLEKPVPESEPESDSQEAEVNALETENPEYLIATLLNKGAENVAPFARSPECDSFSRDILEMYYQNQSVSEIAKKYQIAQSEVELVLIFAENIAHRSPDTDVEETLPGSMKHEQKNTSR